MAENENTNQEGTQAPENTTPQNPSGEQPNTETTGSETLPGEKPEFLPEDCWDADNKQVNSEMLLKAFEQEQNRVKGLRTKLAKGEDKAPKSPDDYDFQFEEGVEVNEDDAMLKAFKQVAHSSGLSNERANKILNEFIKATGGFAANDAEPTPEEIEAHKTEELEKIGANATAVVRAVNSWGKSMVAQGVWSESDLEAIEGVATTADVVIALNKLRSVMGGSDIPTMDSIDDGLPSDREIQQMIASKKYQEGDEATLRKVDELLTRRAKAGRPQYLQV